MKASQFSDAQKAFILKQGAGGRDLLPGRDQPDDLFQLEEEIQRPAAARDAPPQAARGRECQAVNQCRMVTREPIARKATTFMANS
jgi:putative transposase